ncbi:MAG: caspase family protein [Candidatus Babeliaceae bacterium]|nr:caspase family protein [Candidatus Babeliaceae bacterium]
MSKDKGKIEANNITGGIINIGGEQNNYGDATVNMHHSTAKGLDNMPELILTPDTLATVVDLLIPLVQNDRDRRALLTRTFGIGSPLLRQVDWTGNADAFATDLASYLANFGEVETGKPALWELMRTVRSMVGTDKQQHIDALRNALYPSAKSLGDQSMSSKFTHGYALLIGVGQSAYAPASLPVAVKDIQALYRILIDSELCGYPDNDQHIRLLHDAGATRAAILDGLAWLKTQAVADLAATIIVYYSGHGWLDQSTDQYYLIPHDIGFNIAGSALPAEAFSKALHDIPARRLLVFIDSCHAEGMATAKEMMPPGFVSAALPKGLSSTLKQGEGRAVFTSSRGDQSSWIRPDGTMSIYTYHLIEALQGASNKPGDVRVHVSNLMNHLAKAVPDSARTLCQAEQVPFFDTAAEDFPVAMLRGGKGLPAAGWNAVESESRETIQHITNIYVSGGGIAVGGDLNVSNGATVVGRDNIQK